MPNSETGIKGFKWPSESISFNSKTCPKLNPSTNTYLQKLSLATASKIRHSCCARSAPRTMAASERPNSRGTFSADVEFSWWATVRVLRGLVTRAARSLHNGDFSGETCPGLTGFVTGLKKSDGWWGFCNCGPTVDIEQFQKSKFEFVLKQRMQITM